MALWYLDRLDPVLLLMSLLGFFHINVLLNTSEKVVIVVWGLLWQQTKKNRHLKNPYAKAPIKFFATAKGIFMVARVNHYMYSRNDSYSFCLRLNKLRGAY